VLPDTILPIFASVASLSPFVIAQLGPEPLLQVAHDGLVALRQRTTDPRKGRALDAAIGALRAARAHWIDAFHVHAFQRAANSVATSSPYRTSPSRAPMYHFAGPVVDGGDGVSQLSRRVSSDMVLTVSNSCTTLRLASTFSGASPDSGTSLRYFASTSAHSIPRGADPRGKST